MKNTQTISQSNGIVVYDDSATHMKAALQENKGKSGVYR